MDTVRVLRIVEYVGPREAIEEQVGKSIQGEKTYLHRTGKVTIRAATIGTYPEILEPSQETGLCLRTGDESASA